MKDEKKKLFAQTNCVLSQMPKNGLKSFSHSNYVSEKITSFSKTTME